MERSPKRSRRDFGIKCLRLMLDAISVIYLIVACLMIVGATTLKVIFGEYYFTMWYSTLHSLPSLWIATGFFLAAFSIFGLFATFKKSTMMLNLYAIALSLVFILQMAAAITSFTLLTQAAVIVWNAIYSLMSQYFYNYRYRLTMDWIQQTFQCCGNNGPSSWLIFKLTSTSTLSDYDDYTTQSPSAGTIPPSCCTHYITHERTCESYYSRGCHPVLNDIVFSNVLMIGSSALVIGLLQILGVICAVMLAGWVRQKKTDRDIQRWTGLENQAVEEPTTLKSKQEEFSEVNRSHRGDNISYI